MTIHFSSTSTARYMVALRYLDGSDRPFMVFCDTIAEVQQTVDRTLKGMRGFAAASGAEVHLASQNGTKVYADAVKTASKRRMPHLVAKGGQMDLNVLLLK